MKETEILPYIYAGKEIGPFNSLEKVLESINGIAKTDSGKYLMAGQLDEEIKARSGKS
ncbi:MAG: hypothetical protein AAF992_25630 [Bacteroidota bacterium]